MKSIAEIITTQGDINADFADVKKVLENAGQSVMGSAEAGGEDRAIRAIEAALNSPLLNDHDIRGAKRILLTISSSKEHAMRLKEQMAISEHVAKKIQTEARMFKFGAITDKNLGDSLRVTIIAAGFDGTTTLMDQLKGTGDSQVLIDSTIKTDLLLDETDREGVADEFVFADADEASIMPVGVTDNAQEKEMTMTGPGGITITRPDLMPNAGLRPEPGNDGDTLVMDEEERPGDADLIQRTVDAFVNGPYVSAELDRPTFERNKTLLYALPMLPEHEFVRSKLND